MRSLSHSSSCAYDRGQEITAEYLPFRLCDVARYLASSLVVESLAPKKYGREVTHCEDQNWLKRKPIPKKSGVLEITMLSLPDLRHVCPSARPSFSVGGQSCAK